MNNSIQSALGLIGFPRTFDALIYCTNKIIILDLYQNFPRYFGKEKISKFIQFDFLFFWKKKKAWLH